MNLESRAAQNGRTYKRVSNIHGGEYHGPCPSCGGNDRFHIWPSQGDHGTFWCRSCRLGGDAIEYLMKIEGLSFPAACKEVGKEISEQEEYQAPKFKRPATAAESFTPRATVAASDLWIEHATKLVDWSHEQLLANDMQMVWLASRGLSIEAVKAYRLGWNAGENGKDLYRAREAWGLDTVLKEDGKTKKKLWLPIGLTIPYYIDGTLQRIRIRRPEGEPRYYLVPGSNMAPMVLGADSRAFVVVESELDALLVHHLASDLIGAVSQGNSTAKPDAFAATALSSSLSILVALDSDDAGMNASIWWKKHFPQAERWPVPVGKDPGDAFKAGLNIREWILAGLPPVFSVSDKPDTPASLPRVQDNSGASVVAPAAETEQPGELLTRTATTYTAKDGRRLTVTDNVSEYARLVALGEIVFDSKEIAHVKTLGADQDLAARFLDAKQMFPGSRIIASDPDYQAPTESDRTRYQGKYHNAK
jgi:hypothetical protein